jgi:hypothetical protein
VDCIGIVIESDTDKINVSSEFLILTSNLRILFVYSVSPQIITYILIKNTAGPEAGN